MDRDKMMEIWRKYGKTYNVFVTHLGNGGPPIQQAEVLDLVRGEENVILMGDFNFTPDTQQYQSGGAGIRPARAHRLHLRLPEPGCAERRLPSRPAVRPSLAGGGGEVRGPSGKQDKYG